MDAKSVKIGDHVIFVDPVSEERNALVTNVWADPNSQTAPGLNLVMIDKDDSRTDPYGRQIHRETSVVHESMQAAPGFYWKLPSQ